MKKITIAILCISIILTMFSSCDGSTDAQKEVNYDPIIEEYSQESVDSFPDRITNFGLALLKSIDDGESNVLVSPLSVYFALAIATEGASGDTLSEMENVLGMEKNDITAALSLYLKEMFSVEDNALSVSNAVWLRGDSYTVKPTERFTEILERNYNAEIFVSPMNEKTLSKINSWVKENTANRIRKALDSLSLDASAYIVNALCFDGKWSEPYSESSVSDGIFTDYAGRQQKVKYMMSAETGYIETDLGVGFKKSYVGERYAFIAIVPKDGNSLSELIASIDETVIANIIKDNFKADVYTKMPKFTVFGDVELGETLKELGIKRAFEMGDGFSELSPDGQMCLSRIIHKTYIKVHEEGTEAGAVTVIEAPGNAYGAEPKTVYLDRPFVYGIVDVESGIPVLLGTMNHVE